MKSLFKTAALCCVLAMSGAAYAEPLEKVRGPGQEPIRSEQFGTCVQTKWEADRDICAPMPERKVVQQVVEQVEPAAKMVREDLTIYFLFNKSNLTPGAVTKLDAIADAVNKSPKVTKVGIVGYADEIGSESYNKKLSERRAASVKQYLDTKMRIPSDVLDIRGLGETDSKTNCDGIKERQKKIDCLARDRRVEIEFQFLK